jgi:hypothetical protein
MTDAPHPPIQAVKPARKRPQRHKSLKPRGRPIGEGSGRATASLGPGHASKE